jgi:hypothetical protein
MLNTKADAVIAEPDGRGAPNASRHGRRRPCRAGVTGGRGRFRQETGLLMLLRVGPKGYPPLESATVRPQSGECRSICLVAVLVLHRADLSDCGGLAAADLRRVAGRRPRAFGAPRRP